MKETTDEKTYRQVDVPCSIRDHDGYRFHSHFFDRILLWMTHGASSFEFHLGFYKEWSYDTVIVNKVDDEEMTNHQ
jgi:hypothetical protein